MLKELVHFEIVIVRTYMIIFPSFGWIVRDTNLLDE